MSSEQPLTTSESTEHVLSRTVGLISDTHIPTRAERLPKEIFRIFKDVDLIIHAGDLVDLSVVDELEQIAPALAVHGNMDGPEIRERFPQTNSLDLFGWKIGVIHDPSTFLGIRNMYGIARENQFDVLVYGHTHNAHVKWDGSILFVNPGSPTNPIPPFLVKPSVALLRITSEKILPEIVQI